MKWGKVVYIHHVYRRTFVYAVYACIQIIWGNFLSITKSKYLLSGEKTSQ